jgi:hypothetical protein
MMISSFPSLGRPLTEITRLCLVGKNNRAHGIGIVSLITTVVRQGIASMHRFHDGSLNLVQTSIGAEKRLFDRFETFLNAF